MLRSSSYLVATALGLVILAGAASGCASSSGKSFRGHGVSFQYPKDWEPVTFTGNSAQNASGLWTEAFKPRSSSSKADVVFFSEYRTPVAITKRNRAIYSDEVASSVSEVAKQAGGSLLAGPSEVTMGGLPGYAFRISATTRDNLSSESRILLVWSGKREYYLNCQHDTSGSYAADVERGCKKIVGSFKLSR
jgi:PsbP-like protein